MSVKVYSFSKQKEEYCSKHTQVKEFASKSGNKIYSDVVYVDTKLMEMVEKLYTRLNCSKYIISSGYRTPAHDRAVGGNGKGQHTKGKAVDCCFYDKRGRIIPAQIVCCVAQDLGFKGIANISYRYWYVHLDMRTFGTYKGDETKGYNTVTKDFYKYFNLTKEEVAAYTGGHSSAEIEKVAREVINGKYGNGAKRKKAIIALGYDYAEVQAMVNKLIKER